MKSAKVENCVLPSSKYMSKKECNMLFFKIIDGIDFFQEMGLII